MKQLFFKYKEVISYLFWGVCTTIVSWVTYALFVKTCGVPIEIGNVLSWICAVSFAFVTNKLWVFNSKSWKPTLVVKELVSFYGARLATGVVEWVGVPALVKMGLDQTILGIDGMWSKIIVSVIVIVLNYIFSKLIVFNNKEKKQEK